MVDKMDGKMDDKMDGKMDGHKLIEIVYVFHNNHALKMDFLFIPP